MKVDEETRQLAQILWKNHQWKLSELVVGIVLGTAILVFGFWNTAFVVFCGLIGLLVGIKLDRGETFLEQLDRIFPNRFQ